MQIPQSEYEGKESKIGTKRQFRSVTAVCWTLIAVGSGSLIVSFIYSSQILAFIGLSLVFWGGILLFIQPEEYTKKVLLNAALPPSVEALSQIIQELGYKGKAVYLPPKYFKDPETNKAYMPKLKEKKAPDPNLILNQENQLFIKNPKGILFTPPGAQLSKLFEKRLGIDLTRVNLEYIKQNLPALFIDDLEIAENLEIEIKSSALSTEKKGTNYGTIHIKITNPIFSDVYEENSKFSEIYNTIGSPILSAIACTLTKATGNPLIIGEIKSSENGKKIEVTYQVENLEYKEELEAPAYQFEEPEYKEELEAPAYQFEEPEYKEELEAPAYQFEEPKNRDQTETPVAEAIRPFFSPFYLRMLLSLFLIILSSITLVWIGQLSWYEMTVWGKSLGFVLFASRAGEPISLGIGMKVIYYYGIGLTLMFSGIMTYLGRGKKVVEGLVHPPFLPSLVSLSLIIIGSLTLLWISELALYEMTVWGKSLGFVLFASRAGEPISLGIGMKVIYYYGIGLALLFSGIITYLKRIGGK